MINGVIDIKNKMSIVLSQKDNNYIAQLISNPGLWGMGRSVREAIGDLILLLNKIDL